MKQHIYMYMNLNEGGKVVWTRERMRMIQNPIYVHWSCAHSAHACSTLRHQRSLMAPVHIILHATDISYSSHAQLSVTMHQLLLNGNVVVVWTLALLVALARVLSVVASQMNTDQCHRERSGGKLLASSLQIHLHLV